MTEFSYINIAIKYNIVFSGELKGFKVINIIKENMFTDNDFSQKLLCMINIVIKFSF